MAERTLAAIHDPRGRIDAREARRRIRAALGPDSSVDVAHVSPLTVGWTGLPLPHATDPVASNLPFVVVDGEAPLRLTSQPSSWAAALRDARGGFAVIAWQGDRGLAARDHLGARPLFLRIDGAVLYVASELPTLLALIPRRPAPDDRVLALFLAGRSATDGATLFAGIRALPPAHALILDRSGSRLERFWSPAPRGGFAGATAEEAVDALRDGVRTAVRRHGAVAPNAGVLLSGGLDSSAVLTCAGAEAQTAGASLPRAFTAVFPDVPQLDERSKSSRVAARWSSEWTTVPAARGPIAPDAVAHMELWQVPLQYPGSAFFRPVVDEAARRGVRVLLDGEGGDELFGCEPLLLADSILAGDLRGAGRLARALPSTGGRLSARQAGVVLRAWVLPGLLAPRVMTALRRLHGSRAGAPLWLSRSGRDAAVAEAAACDDAWWRAGRPRWRAHLSWVLSDGRAALSVFDHLRRTTRPAGVADAHPFLDVDLVELVLGLPPQLAFDQDLDRPLLRRAMRGSLPDAVRLRRDKVYFDVLLLDTLTGPDRAVVDRTLRGPLELAAVADSARVRALWGDGPGRHRRGPWLWSSEVWRAFAAELWLRREAGNAA